MHGVPEWLADADRVLSDSSSPEHEVDDIVDRIGALDANVFTGSQAAGQIDPVVLDRVIAVLSTRQAAVAAELTDIGRQRAELVKRHRGVAGYTRGM